MKRSKLVFLGSLVCLANTGYGIECPKKVQVKVTEITAIALTNDKKIEEFFTAGDKQTSKDYIKAVLDVAKNLKDTEEVLTYSRKQSKNTNTCYYRGKTTSLSIKSDSYSEEDGYTATLRLGKINYTAKDDNNPTMHKGNALDLSTHLRELDKDSIVAAKNRKSILSFEMEIQIPLGDYGTDGFSEIAEVGKAWVEYSIAE